MSNLIRLTRDSWLNLGVHVDHKAPYVALHFPGFRLEVGRTPKPAHVAYSDKGMWMLTTTKMEQHRRDKLRWLLAKQLDGSWIEAARAKIEDDYRGSPTGCGGSFGEILCYEIHQNNLTFLWLAEKWGISVSNLGILILDHCERLECV